MERARELIGPYTKRDDVVGIYVVGSSTRPYRDKLSDYDFEVIVTDKAYAMLPDDEKHVFVIDDGPPRRVDHEFYLRPLAEFEGLISSTHDLFHGPYQHAEILHDPEGLLADIVERLAALPEDVRSARMILHYLEVIEAVGRIRKLRHRQQESDESELGIRLLAGEAVRALAKLIFLQRGSWPPVRHWTQQELSLVDGADRLDPAMVAVLRDPTTESCDLLMKGLHAWLSDAGETFHSDVNELFHWAFLTEDGKRAFEIWGGR
ncbi:DUF4037 domain-containing protein [Candidatus Bipolaricaulota bacterium]|nr:DUF4037 domain-containing protein [Candidatus Bipolaricaulota bacterium]